MLEHIFNHASSMDVNSVAKHFSVPLPRAKALWAEATSNRCAAPPPPPPHSRVLYAH
jgi:hypothetical protein